MIVVEVNVLGPPHVLWLCLGVYKGMLAVRYFCSGKASFCVPVEFHDVHETYNDEDNSDHPRFFWDIAGFKTVASVCVGFEIGCAFLEHLMRDEDGYIDARLVGSKESGLREEHSHPPGHG